MSQFVQCCRKWVTDPITGSHSGPITLGDPLVAVGLASLKSWLFADHVSKQNLCHLWAIDIRSAKGIGYHCGWADHEQLETVYSDCFHCGRWLMMSTVDSSLGHQGSDSGICQMWNWFLNMDRIHRFLHRCSTQSLSDLLAIFQPASKCSMTWLCHHLVSKTFWVISAPRWHLCLLHWSTRF